MNDIKTKKTISIFTTLAIGLEYFDYVLFPMLGSTFIEIFFNNNYQSKAVNFLFFSLAFYIKIIGSLIFGYLSDISNKIRILKALSLLMIVSTASLAFLPRSLSTNFEFIYLIFVIIRIAQALSFGADMPTSTTIMYEQNTKITTNIAKLILSATIGPIIAMILFNLLTSSFLITHFPKMHLNQFGWRIPLILSTILGIFSFLLRTTKINLASPNKQKEINHMNFSMIRQAFSLLLFPIVLIDINLYFPFYMNKFCGIPTPVVYQSQLYALFFSALCSFILCKYKTNYNVNKTYKILLILFITTSPFLGKILQFSPVIFMCIWQFFITLGMILGIFLTLEILNIKFKTLIYGTIYNINFLISSFLPIIFLILMNKYQNTQILFYLTTLIAAISLIGTIRSKNIK